MRNYVFIVNFNMINCLSVVGVVRKVVIWWSVRIIGIEENLGCEFFNYLSYV